IGNVTGIPYRIAFRGDTSLGRDMILHSDYIRFALSIDNGFPRPDDHARGDEYALAGNSPLNWSYVRAAVLATSAFPVAFDARRVERTRAQLACRAVLIPAAPPDYLDEMVQLVPRWDAIANVGIGGNSTAIAIDGGTMDNEPIGIVRQEL